MADLSAPASPPPAVLLSPDPNGVPRRIGLRTIYFEGQIDLKQFRARHPHYPVLALDPLVIEPVAGCWAAITKFGAVVFWGAPDEIVGALEAELRAMPGANERHTGVEDRVDVLVGAGESRVTFSEIWLRDLSIDRLKVVSLALAQSVALERYEDEVASALARFAPVVDELRRSGRLAMREQEVMKAVGFGLHVRSSVLANLTLFDKPPETWESEALERLDSLLYDFFDLEERLSAINQKLEYCAQVTATLMETLNHRKSVRLEWIVIILIALEFVFFILAELLK